MQIRCRQNSGNTVLITMMTVVILGFSLASYLDLVSNQNLSIMRSEQWNLSIPIGEAGIEEALTQLYYNATNLTANNWTLTTNGYMKERFIGSSKYDVYITTANPPLIISQAFVRIPMQNGFILPPRTIRVTVTNAPAFAKGMVAKGSIDLHGNNIRTDSFDSSNPNYSTNGQYDPAKAKSNGDVATDSSVTDSLNVWNADIYGHASTGPGGTVLVGNNGSVGDAAWHQGGNTGIEPGWTNDDMNVQFPDVQVPFTSGALTPTSGTVNGTNYTYVVGSGNWQLSSLSLSGGQKLLVTGAAALYVTSALSVSGNAAIEIAPGANLQLFVGASSASLGGNGIMNDNGSATNFYYYGLPSNTSIALSGNAAFTGAIYAPEASLTMGGGGNSTYNFVGASVSASVVMNGHYNFHYDENLGNVGPRRGFVLTSWNEIFNWSE